jgi:hypothetical protein
MNFVWITENYRVNIESIFSLEHQINESDEYINWKNNYQNLTEEYKKTFKPIIDDDGNIVTIDNNSSKEEIYNYSKLIIKEVLKIIGNPPERYSEIYVVILQTGLKIIISKDKFEEINKIIDKNMK